MPLWLKFSLVGVITLPAVFLAIPFFARNYEVPPVATMVYWYVGMITASTAWMSWTGRGQELVPGWPHLAIIGLGALFGSASNIALFKAISIAPNPGLPVVLTNGSTLIVLVASVLLYQHAPQHFAKASLDRWHLVGALLTILGVAIITLRK